MKAFNLNPFYLLLISIVMLLLTACPPVANFNLKLGNEALATSQGNTLSTTIKIEANGGFNSPVTLSLEGDLAGINASFSPATTKDESTLKLELAASAVPGIRNLTVKGQSTSVSNTRTLTLTINAAPVADTTAPVSPTGLSATAGDTKISLSWTANSESDLKQYKLYQKQLTLEGSVYDEIAVIPASGSSHSLTGLSNGINYTFVLKAEDMSGNLSAASSEVSAMPRAAADSTPPATPTGLSIIEGDEEVLLSWTANSESDLKEYRLYYGTSSDNLSLLFRPSPEETSFTATALSNDTTYYFAISAMDNANNESPLSETLSATPTLKYQVYGGAMSGTYQTIYVYHKITPIETATVKVNGTTILHNGNGLYYGLISPLAAAGEAINLEVTIGTVIITASDVVPETPVVTAPTTGSSFSATSTIPVTWTSASDPERFVVWATWTDGISGFGKTFEAAGTERSLSIPAGQLPTGFTVKLSVSAYNDGSYTGAYDPRYSKMDIRSVSTGNPEISITP